MKLNPDCIRAVLLEIEKEWCFEKDESGNIIMGSMDMSALCKSLPNYTEEDIFYTLYNLEQAGYVDLEIMWAGGQVMMFCIINCMTYEGHEFLEKIRDTKHWAAVKSGMSAVRNYSLDAINAIASGITGAAIAAYLEKNSLS